MDKIRELRELIDNMSRQEASEIVKGAFGRRPDLLSGEDFVDEIRGHKLYISENIEPDDDLGEEIRFDDEPINWGDMPGIDIDGHLMPDF